jgi:hypothetical protein
MHLQRLPVVALAMTDIARHIDIGQKVHLHALNAFALASLAASALDIEREAPGTVAALACRGRLCEKFANRGKKPCVRGRVGAWGAANRALIDMDHFVDGGETIDGFMFTRL